MSSNHRRVWVYFALVGIRNLLMGITMLAHPSGFKSASFQDVFHLAGPNYWGAVLLGVGVVIGIALATRSTLLARIGLAVAAVMALMLGAAFLLAWINGHASPWGVIVYLAMALEDLTVLTSVLGVVDVDIS